LRHRWLARFAGPVLLGAALAAAAAAAAAAAVPTDPAQVRPLAVGTPLPTLSLRTVEDRPYVIDPARLAAPVLLVFYRGGWCPYCNRHLGELKKVEPELKALGYTLLFVSPDRPAALYASLKEPDVTYTLLSDASMNAARALGIAFRVDDPTLEKYRSFGIDLEAASGERHHELPVPAVFIVGRDGRIAFVHANPDYTTRISPDDVLAAARRAAER
jgi:peroxiredoxin